MGLSRHERTVLDWFRHSRAEPPTVATLFRRHFPRLLLPAVVVAAVAVYEWERAQWVSVVCIGFFAGVVLERLAEFREIARGWPVWAKVLDFERVNALLDSDGPPAL